MSFEKTIEKYLQEKAANDTLFAVKFANENKNLQECCSFIVSEVRKKNEKNSRVVCMTDEEVYGLAVHYYDEDDIQISDEMEGVNVVSSDDAIANRAEKVRLETVFQIPDAPAPTPAAPVSGRKRKKQDDPAQLSFF